MNFKQILLLLFLLTGVLLFSHPHMQILSRSQFEFENKKISGVWLEWEFDAYFSADIIMSYDYNNDGKFNTNETNDIYNSAFINLKDFDYFTYIRVGENRTSPKKVYNFSAKIDKNNNVIYKFYITLSDIKEREFYLSVYDFTYFCACFYQEDNPVTFINSNSITPEFEIKKNEDYPIYFDPYAGPGDNTVHTEWKEGLNKIVIKEIHVKY